MSQGMLTHRLSFRFLGLILMISMGSPKSILRAQSGSDAQPGIRVLHLPEDAPVPPNVPPPSRDKDIEAISDAIRGESPSGSPIAHAVQEIIRRNGSVMRDSALDPARSSGTLRNSETLSQPKPAFHDGTADADRLRVAEMLLKSARLLDKVGSSSENRDRLVNEMRREAVRLMMGPMPKRSGGQTLRDVYGRPAARPDAEPRPNVHRNQPLRSNQSQP